MADTVDMAVDMVDMAMVDTVAREKPNHTMDMVVVMVDMVDTVDTEDTVDTVESVKPKLPQNHTTEVMVDTVMVDMVDTDTVDTVTASKRLISNILPFYISPTFNLESFTKIQDNMF